MKNDEYWQERVRKQQEIDYKENQATLKKELHKVYAKATEVLQSDILRTFAKVEQDKWDGKPVQINDFYRTARYWQMLERMNQLIAELGEAQTNITLPALVELYEKSMATITKEAPESLVKQAFVVPSAVDAKQAVAQAWALDGKDFSSRVWEDKSLLKDVLRRELENNIINQRGPWETAKRVMECTGQSERNALRLARTEGAHAQIMGAQRRYKELGFQHGKFLPAPDCCDKCQQAGGEIFPIEQASRMLPAHPNCRCSFVAVP